MTTWIWQSIAIDLPSDWEMLQYSTDAAQGRIAFADREDFRLEVSWKRTGARPDLKRLLGDYRARLVQDPGYESVEIGENSEWLSLLSTVSGRAVSRFVRHFEETGLLVELVLLWDEKRDGSTETRILGSVSVVDSQKTKSQRWKCFGLDVTLPADLRLSDINALPASVVMQFGLDRPAEASVRVERRGFTKFWLKSSVSDWLLRQLPRKPRKLESFGFDRVGHTVTGIRGTLPFGSGWGGFLRLQQFESIGWICPHDRRLYSLVRLNRQSHSGLFENNPLTLSCCSRMADTA